ncbi:ABC transporter permease [Cryptosporangium aurantiacum]|uniref:Peptide/nickel transport system permease protein n=1 Tax=Cryptosporangium aurantiacum TaxID=134849 RepID=A0A1M7NMC1_9ACTN|nr:ABC transporter permease [Cryptosporangium aurantiacum]SHN04634.1 peptide/nickel transport system permease protein [Cryptosporangium aurantiacum]
MTSLLTRKRDRIDDLAEHGNSLTRDAIRRLSRNPVAILGAVIVLIFVLVAIFAPLLAPKDPYYRYLIDEVRQNTPLPPREGFPLGADQNGRDVLSRLIVGARQSLLVGVLATLAGLVIGMLIGGLAGAFGGWVDTVLMRFVDILLSVPSLLLAISIAALFQSANQWTVIAAVAIVSVPIFARLLRGAMLAQRHADHVLAARALGVHERSIVLRHMLPNSLSAVIVQATLTLATSIIDAAALSFLGLGDADPNRAEWGAMLGDAQVYFDIQPSLAVWPALCIIVVALGFTLFGESLREALDPKNRR